MDDRQLYQAILGLTAPWQVEKVELRKDVQEVDVHVRWPEKTAGLCPECGASSPIYDHLERRWRHLDTCQFKTLLVAQVPRTNCPSHGVKQMNVPWAVGPRAQFTALFESLVINWLKAASVSAVAKQLKLSWDEVFGIMRRAVDRGMARRKPDNLLFVGVDEKAYQKGHKYFTVMCDLDRVRVLDVSLERKRESLNELFGKLTLEQKSSIKAVAMDMWDPFVKATQEQVPQALIVFDKFHVSKHLNEAVDRVRKVEAKELSQTGDERLKRTKYQWLKNPVNFTREKWAEFKALRDSNLKVARAWSLKETAMTVWNYLYEGVARKRFEQWYSWAIRSRLEPMKEKARMLKRHLENILNYITYPITNAASEGLNSKIQWVKYTARGYANTANFRTAILFHCGALDLTA